MHFHISSDKKTVFIGDVTVEQQSNIMGYVISTLLLQ